MQRAVGGRRDEGQVDVGLIHAGQLNLCLFCGILQSLQHHLVVPQVYAVFLLELIRHPVDDALVEVVAAQMVVTGGRQHLEDTVRDLEQRYIKGTAAEVKDHDLLILFLVHTVCQCGGGRLVDDTQNLQTGDLAGVLGRLTLCVGEVSRHRDDSLRHGRTEIRLGIRLHLLQNHSGNLLRRVALAVNGYLVVAAHLTLDGADRAVRVGDRLPLCDLTDHTLAGLGESHYGRSRPCAFGIGDHDRLGALVDRHTGIRSTQINTNDFSHNIHPPNRCEVSIICMIRFDFSVRVAQFATRTMAKRITLSPLR